MNKTVKKVQVHFVPSGDRKFKHNLNDKCECGADLTISKSGMKILSHKKMGRSRDLFNMKLSMDGNEVVTENYLEILTEDQIDQIKNIYETFKMFLKNERRNIND